MTMRAFIYLFLLPNTLLHASLVTTSTLCPFGRVVDSFGHPVFKAEIYLNGARVGESDDNGGFRLTCENVSAPYHVRIESNDYEPMERLWNKNDSLWKLVPDTSLRGVLTDRAGSLAGINVGLLAGQPWQKLSFDEINFSSKILMVATTSPGGRFRFPNIKTGYYRLRLEAPRHVGYLTEILKFRPESWHTRNFDLQNGVELTGRIMADGKPVMGAVIRPAYPAATLLNLIDHTDGALPLRYTQPNSIYSGSDGHFVITELPPDQVLALFVTHTGHASVFKKPLNPTAPVEIFLAKGGTVTGHVRGEKSEMLKGVTVVALPQLESSRWILPGTAPDGIQATLFKPDTDGIPYRITGIMDGDAIVVADAPGFALAKADVQGPTDGSTLLHDFTLEKGWRLTGVIVNERGSAVRAEINPFIVGSGWLKPAGPSVHSLSGPFDLPALKSRIVDLRVTAIGYAQVHLKAVDAELAGPLRIALPNSAVLTGQVVDENSYPITEFNVIAVGDGYMPPQPVICDDGRFAVPLPLIETRSVRILVPGRPPFIVDNLSIKPGDRHDLGVLSLPGGMKLAGSVLDEKSQPVEGATVTVTLRIDQQYELETNTNSRGQFELKGIKPGDYELNARHPHFISDKTEVVVSAVTGSEAIAIHLKRGLRLIVEVKDEAGSPAISERILAGDRIEYMHEEAAGRYIAEGVKPGRTFLWFMTPPFFSRIVEITSDAAPALIKRGRTHLEGMVRRNGQPAAIEKVQLSMVISGTSDPPEFDLPDRNRLTTVTDSKGRFQFSDVLNSDYVFGSGNARKRLTLDGGNMTADLDLPGGGLKGCVVDASNHQPLSGVSAWLYVQSQSQHVETDASGCYSFKEIIPGKYRVNLVYGDVHQHTEEIEVGSDVAHVPILEMSVGNGRIALRINNRDDGNSPSCDLFYSLNGGGMVRTDAMPDDLRELTSLPSGDYQIYATCKGRATTRAVANLHEPDGMSASINLVTVPESIIRVKLNDARGQAVDRYEARATPTSSDCPTPYENDFAHDGNPALINNLPSCDYRITVRTPDNKKVSTTLHLDEGVTKEVLLTLP